MSSEQEFVSKTSEQSEVFDTSELEDIQWVLELAQNGIPPAISNAYDSAISLSRYVYDEFIPQESEAKEFIEKAVALFESSYAKSIAFTVEEANRIIALHYGTIHYQGATLLGVGVQWTPNGEAMLEFQTDLTQTTD